MKLEVPMRVDAEVRPQLGRRQTYLGRASRDRAGTPRSRQLNRKVAFGGSNTKATPEFRTSELRSGSETEHNLDCAETDVGPIEAHICAQCQLDPPDGREQQRQLSAGESLWLHAHCEDAFIRRRMAEEGIASSPAASAEKPAPSPSAPPPRRINGSNLPPPPPPLEIALTRFTKDGGPLTKQISLAADGTLMTGRLGLRDGRGTAERVRVAGVDALGALIEDLTPSQALALGALRADLPDKVAVTTKKMLLNGAARPDLIARTGANIVYHGPAFALLDFDSKAMPATVAAELQRRGGFWPALLTVLPALDDVARVTRSSTSAGLSRADTGAAMPESDGVHVYRRGRRTVPTASDFLRALHDRCWLAGFGLDDGQRQRRPAGTLDRRPHGRSGSERLVFEGGPVLVPPLQQDKASRRPIAIDGVVLDTVAACPPLSIVEQSRLDELKARERERLAPEKAKAQSRVRRAASQEAGRAHRHLRRPRRDRSSSGNAKAYCGRISSCRSTTPIWPGAPSATCWRTRSVSRARRWPTRWRAWSTGRCMAKDHAPGRRHAVDPLVRPWPHHLRAQVRCRRVRKAMEQAAKEEVVATFARLAAGADLDAVELAELRQLAKKLSGVGLRRSTPRSKRRSSNRPRRTPRPRARAMPPVGRTRGHG